MLWIEKMLLGNWNNTLDYYHTFNHTTSHKLTTVCLYNSFDISNKTNWSSTLKLKKTRLVFVGWCVCL